MVRLLWIALLSVSSLSACVSAGPRILSSGTDAQIRTEAVRDAQADLAAGRPQICRAGTIASYPVDVPADAEHLVTALPERRLPSGCRNRLASRAIVYAGAYNREIVRSRARPRSERPNI